MTGYVSKKMLGAARLPDTPSARAYLDKVLDDDDTQVYKKPWVDLTDEEIADYLGDEYHDMTESELRFFRLGEVAAKEKNNGT